MGKDTELKRDQHSVSGPSCPLGFILQKDSESNKSRDSLESCENQRKAGDQEIAQQGIEIHQNRRNHSLTVLCASCRVNSSWFGKTARADLP